MLILLNFSASNAQANIGLNISKAKVLLSNYKDAPVNNAGKTYHYIKTLRGCYLQAVKQE